MKNMKLYHLKQFFYYVGLDFRSLRSWFKWIVWIPVKFSFMTKKQRVAWQKKQQEESIKRMQDMQKDLLNVVMGAAVAGVVASVANELTKPDSEISKLNGEEK